MTALFILSRAAVYSCSADMDYAAMGLHRMTCIDNNYILDAVKSYITGKEMVASNGLLAQLAWSFCNLNLIFPKDLHEMPPLPYGTPVVRGQMHPRYDTLPVCMAWPNLPAHGPSSVEVVVLDTPPLVHLSLLKCRRLAAVEDLLMHDPAPVASVLGTPLPPAFRAVGGTPAPVRSIASSSPPPPAPAPAQLAQPLGAPRVSRRKVIMPGTHTFAPAVAPIAAAPTPTKSTPSVSKVTDSNAFMPFTAGDIKVLSQWDGYTVGSILPDPDMESVLASIMAEEEDLRSFTFDEITESCTLGSKDTWSHPAGHQLIVAPSPIGPAGAPAPRPAPSSVSTPSYSSHLIRLDMKEVIPGVPFVAPGFDPIFTSGKYIGTKVHTIASLFPEYVNDVLNRVTLPWPIHAEVRRVLESVGHSYRHEPLPNKELPPYAMAAGEEQSRKVYVVMTLEDVTNKTGRPRSTRTDQAYIPPFANWPCFCMWAVARLKERDVPCSVTLPAEMGVMPPPPFESWRHLADFLRTKLIDWVAVNQENFDPAMNTYLSIRPLPSSPHVDIRGNVTPEPSLATRLAATPIPPSPPSYTVLPVGTRTPKYDPSDVKPEPRLTYFNFDIDTPLYTVFMEKRFHHHLDELLMPSPPRPFWSTAPSYDHRPLEDRDWYYMWSGESFLDMVAYYWCRCSGLV